MSTELPHLRVPYVKESEGDNLQNDESQSIKIRDCKVAWVYGHMAHPAVRETNSDGRSMTSLATRMAAIEWNPRWFNGGVGIIEAPIVERKPNGLAFLLKWGHERLVPAVAKMLTQCMETWLCVKSPVISLPIPKTNSWDGQFAYKMLPPVLDHSHLWKLRGKVLTKRRRFQGSANESRTPLIPGWCFEQHLRNI